MYKVMTGIAAAAFMGAVALPMTANAAEHKAPAAQTQTLDKGQSVQISAQRWHGRRYGYGYRGWGGPRRYWGPRYGYYRPYGYYGYGGYPYGYYGRPYYGGVGVGIGPFGFRFF